MGEDDLRLLEPAELAQRVRVRGARAASFTPHCGRVDPARLARGLAVACERRGVVIYEGTEAETIEPGRVRCTHGSAARRISAAGDGVLHRAAARRAPAVHAALLAHDRHGAAARGGVGRARLGRPGDGLRPPPSLLLRPAQPRRPHRDRRPRRAVSPRLADRRVLRAQRQRARAAPAYDRGALPGGRLGGRHAPLGRAARRAARLVLLGALRPRHGLRLGGRLHRAMAWSRATCSAGRWPTSSCDARPISSRCPGSGHASPRWEPEPLRFLASRAIVSMLGSADAAEDRRDRPAWRTRLVQPFMQVRS